MNGSIKFQRGDDLAHLETEFGKIFDAFIPKEHRNYRGGVWSPRTDVAESESAFTLDLDLPGLSKDDIDISFHDGVLEISGERTLERNEETENVFRYERRAGSFSRKFNLGKAVNAAEITATYDAGVLTVTVPKAEESKPRKIKVG